MPETTKVMGEEKGPTSEAARLESQTVDPIAQGGSNGTRLLEGVEALGDVATVERYGYVARGYVHQLFVFTLKLLLI